MMRTERVLNVLAGTAVVWALACGETSAPVPAKPSDIEGVWNLVSVANDTVPAVKVDIYPATDSGVLVTCQPFLDTSTTGWGELVWWKGTSDVRRKGFDYRLRKEDRTVYQIEKSDEAGNKDANGFRYVYPAQIVRDTLIVEEWWRDLDNRRNSVFTRYVRRKTPFTSQLLFIGCGH